jgi:mannan endo-1,6-alpha-mannosidase
VQKVFFPAEFGGKTMTEYACEANERCNKDQVSFKAYLSRWMAVSAQLAPFSAGQIMPLLQGSAVAAMKQCSGGPPGGVVCGRKWYAAQDDGTRDIGNQMSALGVVSANLISQVSPPVDVNTGTSVGNAAAGGVETTLTADDILATRPITRGDKAGAWIVTVVVFIWISGISAFLVSSSNDMGFITNWYSSRAGFK